ncbi:MAG: adaptor protein MecA [Clostridiales bacterium]|nr:adaptor protein MecA [Clostridiales bacterium]
MEFSRIGEHTIRCVVSENEINSMGFTLEEIMSNGERTQEFMNTVFELAERQFETKFNLGVKTVRADFMSDHTLALTFSEHPGAESMMEHLRDIISGLLSAIPQQKLEELQAAAGASGEAETVRVIATIVFDSMDTLIRYARQVNVPEFPPNSLYKYKNRYHLILDFTEMSEEEVRRMSTLTDEYADELLIGPERGAYIEEHGEWIIKENAIEQLRQL